ncbi:HIRAN domain-containing protein [Arthrobacter sp. V4I6]|uniref:HIRAN domain-containing protein n=1 Tax=unclassified Arthrobacter TaxID=235627 RepID=UPI003594602E
MVGMGYCADEDRPQRFRIGQSVGMLREPENEYDTNAVAITVGRPATKIGYVNKQRAKWVAQLLDSGHKLEGLVIQTKSSPRVLLTTPEILAHLRRD